MPDWFNFVFPALAFLGQAGLVFYFLGKMKGSQDGFAALFDAYQKNQSELLEAYRETTAAQIASLKDAVTTAVNGNHSAHSERARLREELAAFKATTESEGRFTRECLERVTGSIEGLQRQMANVAAGRTSGARGRARASSREARCDRRT